MKYKDALIEALQKGKYRDANAALNCYCCIYLQTGSACMGKIDCEDGMRLFLEAEIGSIKLVKSGY